MCSSQHNIGHEIRVKSVCHGADNSGNIDSILNIVHCQVVWYQDTMKLMDSSHVHMSSVGHSHKLTISRLDSGHWSAYHCTASNSLADKSEQIILTGYWQSFNDTVEICFH